MTSDWKVHPADLALIVIGVLPNQELAAAAGLPLSNGIELKDVLLTFDLATSVVGDSADRPLPHAHDGRVRIESVQGAVDTAKCDTS